MKTFFLVLLIIVVAILFVRNRKLSGNEGEITSYSYLAKNHLMTKREEKFFVTLNDIFGSKCYVVPQVHLSALLNHKVRGQNWKGAFSHINGKSVDFALLRHSDLSVLCAIELDDSSHDSETRTKRDREVKRIFEQAKIPLVRFKNPEAMSKQQIADFLAEQLKTVEK